jgi:hypothetical protein
MNYRGARSQPKWKSPWSRGHTVGRTCRVCGLSFRSRRFDAITCSSTCRQRLRRGQAFTYLAGLSQREQAAERKRHATFDAHIALHREWMGIVRKNRAEKRAHKQEHRREQAVTKMLATMMLDQLGREEKQRHEWLTKIVAGAISYLAGARANDMSTQAVRDTVVKASGHDEITVEQVQKVLDDLHAGGHYDRIVTAG